MKAVFNHCWECSLYDRCYDLGEDGEIIGGPHMLEPACEEPLKETKTDKE